MSLILIVEDNEMNRDMLSRRLERRGFEIICAINGQEAIEQTQQHKPDIVLMDMSLPIMDGWEATQRLKENDSTRHIPIVGLSAHARPVDIIRGKEAGCDDYETKPVDFEKLINTINNLLGD